jgi:hypothetical protein
MLDVRRFVDDAAQCADDDDGDRSGDDGGYGTSDSFIDDDSDGDDDGDGDDDDDFNGCDDGDGVELRSEDEDGDADDDAFINDDDDDDDDDGDDDGDGGGATTAELVARRRCRPSCYTDIEHASQLQEKYSDDSTRRCWWLFTEKRQPDSGVDSSLLRTCCIRVGAGNSMRWNGRRW